jgi:hypothetical protein
MLSVCYFLSGVIDSIKFHFSCSNLGSVLCHFLCVDEF